MRYSFISSFITIIGIVFFFGLNCKNLTAQSNKEYVRKSISYMPIVIGAESSPYLIDNYDDMIINELRKVTETVRFDLNEIPEIFEQEFLNAVNTENTLTITRVQTLLERTVVPSITEILELNAEIRARNLVTEAQRNSFIVVKAKEYGVTAAQLEQILNTGYICVPFITSIKVNKEIDYRVIIVGGLLWYRVVINTGNNEAILLTATKTKSLGRAQKGLDYGYLGYDSHKEMAAHSAVKNFARNIGVLTRNIPDFQLFAQILQRDGMSVKFALGKSEGIQVNDIYQVMEQVMTEQGKTISKNRGYFYVTHVAGNSKNPSALSVGRLIHSDGVTRGMRLKEYSKVGINYSFGYRNHWVRYVNDNGDILQLDKQQIAKSLYMSAQYDFGRSLQIPQLYFTIGGYFGWGEKGNISYGSMPISSGTLTQVVGTELGLVKKYYIGPIAFGGQLLTGFESREFVLSEEIQGEDHLKDVPYGYYSYGGLLEFSLSPKRSIGFRISHREVGMDLPDFYTKSEKPLALNIYITSYPRQVLFDPIRYILGNIGITFE